MSTSELLSPHELEKKADAAKSEAEEIEQMDLSNGLSLDDRQLGVDWHRKAGKYRAQAAVERWRDRDMIKKLATNDMAKLHGTLLTLAALADSTANLPAEPREELRAKIFSATCSLLAPSSSRQLRTSHAVLFAALSSIASSAPFSSPSASSAAQLSSNWFELVHLACEHQEESVHEQAGAAMRRISEMCIVATLLADLDSRSGTRQQCAVVLLGQVDYAGVNRGKLVEVVERLTVFVQREGQMKAATEARRNGVEALASILCKQTEEDPLSVSRFSLAFDTLLAGFSDYTTDQRGDVGSWVRISTIKAPARLTASAKAVASFLALPSVGIVAAEKVPLLLLHPQGWVRSISFLLFFGISV
ncbi:hypothetical protein JCM1840_000853 [Sporobolomyces johnsonii]